MYKFRKILLVYPEIPSNTYWSFKYALQFLNKKSAMPPLGLITVAALFPQEYELKLVDMNVTTLKQTDIEWADAVFISAMMVQQNSFKEVVKMCNQAAKPIVAGGPYSTVSYQEITGVNNFLLGEVEDIFPQFLQEFQQDSAKAVYPLTNKPDITNSPIPRFDLLDMNAYSSMSIQYSRGCPFNCEFCDIWQVYGRQPRVKSATSVVNEINTLHQLGWEGPIFVVDDNFIGNKPHAKQELLPAILQWQQSHNFVYRFYTEASINMAEDEALLAAMRDVGFNAVFLGIETPSNEALKETGKLQNLKSNLLTAIKRIQQYGMEVMGGFILGFDSDKEDIFDRQIDFIQHSGISKAMVGLLHAIPGTNLYKRLKQEGRIIKNPFGNNTHVLETNFITKLNPEVLKAGYQKVLQTLYGYNLKYYFKRCNQLLDNLGNAPFFQRKIKLNEIKIFFRSTAKQFFKPYSYQYLKFFLRNFFKNRQFLAEVVRMAIEGHHFYIITRQTLKLEKFSSNLDNAYNQFAEKFNIYTQQLTNNTAEKYQTLKRLWNYKKKRFNCLLRKINKMPTELRSDLIKKYEEVDKKIKTLFKIYNCKLSQH